MNIDKLIKEMSVQEKIAQMNQKLYGWEIYDLVDGEVIIKDWFKDYVKEHGAIGSIYGVLRADPFTKKNFENGLSPAQSQLIIKKISDYIYDVSPHNIRPFFVEETPHGHQGLNSVLYPTNIAIGATFNPELYRKSIIELSEYMESLNVNIGLFSGLDIVRNPKWGRSEECFSEDPHLAERFVNIVASSAKTDTFTACLKHFAAQGDPYIGQNSGSVNIGERELRELHLKSAEKNASKFDMVMAAYNEIDGIPCHANKKLLDTMLRKEFGFDGIVLADGCALDRLVSENVDVSHAAKLSLDAGVDLGLWDNVYQQLPKAIEEGVVTEQDLDKAVERILLLKQRLGLIEQEILTKDLKVSNTNISYELASESIVLAKNNEVLPIQSNHKVLLVGNGIKDIYTLLGDYTSIQDTSIKYSVLEYFQKINPNVKYCDYAQLQSIDVNQFDRVIVCCGGTSKRNFDMEFDSNGAILTTKSKEMECGENADVGSIRVKVEQEQAISYLKDKNVPTIALFIQGRSYSMESVYDNADAIVLAFYPGQEGAKAIHDIMYGLVNPSGKCPITILKSADYCGYSYNSKKDFRKDTYIDNDRGLAFGFGHGLSYSDFVYKDLVVKVNEENLVVSVDVENISDISGKEVVQVYVEKANTIITKRRAELIAFAKREIEKQCTERFDFTISLDELKTINLDMQKELEPGSYKIYIGTGETRILVETINL